MPNRKRTKGGTGIPNDPDARDGLISDLLAACKSPPFGTRNPLWRLAKPVCCERKPARRAERKLRSLLRTNRDGGVALWRRLALWRATGESAARKSLLEVLRASLQQFGEANDRNDIIDVLMMLRGEAHELVPVIDGVLQGHDLDADDRKRLNDARLALGR